MLLTRCVLYTAMTRAREKLYVTGKSSLDDVERYIERCKRKRETLDSYTARRLSSYLEIVLCASEGGGFVGGEDFIGFVPETEENLTEESTGEEVQPEVISPELYKTLSDRFNYTYPNILLKDLPRKLSVSKTTPTVLDGTEGEDVYMFEANEDRPRLPAFMDPKSSEESKKRGIATHYLLQFADLSYLEKNGAAAELKRLFDGGFISPSDRDRVRVEEIELFRNSGLFKKMLRAKNLYRELRFTLKIPADELTSEELRSEAYRGRKVLVQGVIDCIVEDENGDYFVVDYKTDRLSEEELSSKEKLEQTMRARHGVQLSYYAKAAEEIFGKAPVSTQVYSLQFGDSVDVSVKS